MEKINEHNGATSLGEHYDIVIGEKGVCARRNDLNSESNIVSFSRFFISLPRTFDHYYR